MNTSLVAGETETLRSQLDEKERTIAGLQEQQLSWQQTQAEIQQEMAALKDRLNVSEVHCVFRNFTDMAWREGGEREKREYM